MIAVTWLSCFLVYPTFRLWLLPSYELSQLSVEHRLDLFHQATVPGIDLAGGYEFTVQANADRLTARSREQTSGQLMNIWRTRFLDFGILETVITQDDAMSFTVRVPISADTSLVKKMLQQSGRVTLHIFKKGTEVQTLRERIDTALQEKVLADTTGQSFPGKGGLTPLLASLTLDEGISDIVVKEENLLEVQAILADSTIKRSIRSYNLANPPAGAFTWATEPIERNGQWFYPLYFINQDVDLNAQPLSTTQVDEASVTADRGAYAVRLILQEDGRESLANLSNANKGNRLAIKMDGRVQITLAIQGRIPDGRVELPGGNTVDEASALSALLRSDILPVAVAVTAIEGIPPSIEGAPSPVNTGLLALGIAIIILSLLFVVLYRATGGIVVLGFAFQILMMVALLRLWNLAGITPLLTLSSVVGILFSILVFSMIHIWCFEQLKESLRDNDAPRQLVPLMFSTMQPVVIWVHVLLLLVGIGFVVIGTEALTNFGLALFAGIGSGLLTFFVFTRALLIILTDGWNLKKLSI